MLEDVEFDPVKVFEQMKNNAAIRAGDKQFAFKFNKTEAIPTLCRSDVTRLSQIANNILSNAIKFTSEEKFTMGIAAIPKPGNRTSLTLTISDTGIGVAHEKLERIFESFTQDKIDNKRKYGHYISKPLKEQALYLAIKDLVGPEMGK